MPTAEQLTIKWEQHTAAQILRIVNTCNPWNKGAGSTINNLFVGITEVEIENELPPIELKPGTIIACNKKDGLQVKTMDNKIINITIVYIIEGFFTGYKLQNIGIKVGDVFE